MSYAGDRLYNDFIRSKMAELATKVKVREILAHLPCLTISDREEVEAKRESAGNYSAMMVLLDNLRRRENWPDQFISALQACEQRTLANEISESYDRIRGIHTKRTTAAASAPHPPAAAAAAATVSPAACSPPAPAPAAAASSASPSPSPSPAEGSATVTKATIHSAPHFTPPLLTPSVEASALSLCPSPINSPPRPHHNKAAPASTEVPALVSAPDVPVHTPSKSPQPSEPPVLVLAPDAGPPTPVSAPNVTSSVGQSKLPIGSEGTPTLGISGGLNNPALPGPFSVSAPTLTTNPTSPSSQVNKPVTTSLSSASPEKSKVPVAVVESSSSVKQPVQETHPPGTVLPQDPQKNQTISQVVTRTHSAVSPTCQTQETTQERAQASPSASTAIAASLSNFAAKNEENLSKPGVLRDAEPFSVSSDCLQISCMTANSAPVQPARPQAMSNHQRAEEPVNRSLSATSDDAIFSSSTTTVPLRHDSESVDSTPRALENGFPESDSNSYANHPVEDHYESLLTDPRTRVHLVQVSGEPSVQNLSGQPLNMVGSITVGHNSEADGLVQSVSEGASGQINILQSEQRETSQGVLYRFQSNIHLIATAAIGLTAVFVALKFKK